MKFILQYFIIYSIAGYDIWKENENQYKTLQRRIDSRR